MRSWLANLNDRQETVVVLSVAFGLWILASLWYVATPEVGIELSNGDLLFVVFQECVLLGVVWKILEIRGWRIKDLTHRFEPIHLLGGAALGLASYLLYGISYSLLTTVFPSGSLSYSAFGVGSLAVPLVILVSIVNPIFEEFLVVGFVFASASKWTSVTTALNISVGVRLAYHLYQGPIGVISIIPMGLVFGLAYMRWKNIWPLVIGHAMMDIIGLSAAQIAT